MTEAEWLTATDPLPMWWHVENVVSMRKLQLASCACVRRVWTRLDENNKRMVELAEDLADGRITREEAFDARIKLSGDSMGVDLPAAARSTLVPHNAVLRVAASIVARNVSKTDSSDQHEQSVQTKLFRCIFSNPFAPVAFDSAWRSETAVALASGIYAERAFDRLPILADALEEAGCNHPDIFAHCRGPGPHSRGCWVVDGVLGKS